MADNTSRRPKGTRRQEATRIPVSPVRRGASPEELAAVAALFAILASATDDEDGADSSGSLSQPSWRRQSRWGSPRGMVRTTLPHGPGGWRASALSR